MNTIDTRELLEDLENLQEQIVEGFNETFETDFIEFDEIEVHIAEHISEEDFEEFKEYWADEYNSIREITELREDVDGYAGDDFEDGIQLILEEDFKEYCKDLIEECYDLNSLPDFLKYNIDWERVADDLRVDYSEVEFRGDNYLYR